MKTKTPREAEEIVKRDAKTRSWWGKSGKERRKRWVVGGDEDRERAPHIQVLRNRT